MKSMAKGMVALMFGTLLYVNGGFVKEVNAQSAWDLQEQINRQNQQAAQDEYYRQQREAEVKRQQEIAEYNKQHSIGQPHVPPPSRQKPSSYGAVAWGKGALGSSSNQATKQNAIDAALKKCSDAACQIKMVYSNQCAALSYGVEKGATTYLWQVSNGLTQKKAEQQSIKDCNKTAKNCKVAFSECSLPDNLGSNQPQQYKGLGE